jgi:hypothetical protein
VSGRERSAGSRATSAELAAGCPETLLRGPGASPSEIDVAAAVPPPGGFAARRRAEEGHADASTSRIADIWMQPVKFADTRSVQTPDPVCELLAVVALAELGCEHEGIGHPRQIVELGNRLAGAGRLKVLEQLNAPDLRLTALDKALKFAASLRSPTSGAS